MPSGDVLKTGGDGTTAETMPLEFYSDPKHYTFPVARIVRDNAGTTVHRRSP
jgi:hypothetical protein